MTPLESIASFIQGIVDTWPPAAIASVVAAAVAASTALVVSVANVVLGIVNVVTSRSEGRASRELIARHTSWEQWWTRWSWTIDNSFSSDLHTREAGAEMMDAMIDMPWTTEEDELIAEGIALAIKKRNAAERDASRSRLSKIKETVTRKKTADEEDRS